MDRRSLDSHHDALACLICGSGMLLPQVNFIHYLAGCLGFYFAHTSKKPVPKHRRFIQNIIPDHAETRWFIDHFKALFHD